MGPAMASTPAKVVCLFPFQMRTSLRFFGHVHPHQTQFRAGNAPDAKILKHHLGFREQSQADMPCAGVFVLARIIKYQLKTAFVRALRTQVSSVVAVFCCSRCFAEVLIAPPT